MHLADFCVVNMLFTGHCKCSALDLTVLLSYCNVLILFTFHEQW